MIPRPRTNVRAVKVSTRTVMLTIGVVVGVAWFAVGMVYVATVHHPLAGLILIVTGAVWLFTVTSRGFGRTSR